MSVVIPPDATRCRTKGCLTILCRANPGPDCFYHTDVKASRRIKLDREEWVKRLMEADGDLMPFITSPEPPTQQQVAA